MNGRAGVEEGFAGHGDRAVVATGDDGSAGRSLVPLASGRDGVATPSDVVTTPV